MSRPAIHPGTQQTAADGAQRREQRGRDSRRVTLVSGVVNLLMSTLQVVVGMLANSAALIADGIHSLSDLLSDVLVWFAARQAAQAPDREHPYGHGRFETAATLGLGIILVLVALGIVANGVERLFEEALAVPGLVALVVAGLGIAAKESLYWYTLAAARRLKSEMLRANAWHHRSDAISSVVVLIGVGGAVAGYAYMDAIAAILVGAMVAKIGWDLGWSALTELVDTALDEAKVSEAKRVIMAIDGVRSVHMLRTRRHGAEASADVHVQVAPRLSVSEGHMISQAVEDRLIEKLDEITDVTVHIDPEDDQDAPPCRGLPLRNDAIGQLEAAWRQAGPLPAQYEVRLHYLGGRIEAELVLPLASYVDTAHTEAQQQALDEAAQALPWFRGLRILYA